MDKQEIEFSDVVNNFLSRNNLEGYKDKYIKKFGNQLGKFLGQNELKDNKEISNFLLEMMGEYKYYSKDFVECAFKNFYKYIEGNYNLEQTIFSPIPSEKDYSRANSSNFYLSKFLEINDLSNDQQLILSSLFLSAENKYLNKHIKNIQTGQIEADAAKENKAIQNKLKYIKTIICIDDFSGTGKTIYKFLEKCQDMIKTKNVIIYVIHLTQIAEEKINEAFNVFGYTNARIISEESSQKLFVKGNSIKSKIDKMALKEFEENIIKSKNPLGFGETEALVTFYRNCPNNTLSSYWWTENSNWAPLFPRENGKIVDFHGFKNAAKLAENIKYNFKIMVPLEFHNSYNFKHIIILVYLLSYASSAEEFELQKILGYTDKQLLEEKNKMAADGFLSTDLALNENGRNLLKKLKLEKVHFSVLTNRKEMQASDDSLTIKDPYVPVKLQKSR